jgi:serine/threonine-protein kinase
MVSPPIAPGQLIAETYRVEHVLGKGGMGVVVQAVHAVLGHRVAIKVLTVAGADETAVERFVQEARIAAHLPSEHVCRVTDVGRTPGGQAYFVMELLEGNDLEGELRARGALPVREAVDLILQACEGVADAHAMGLVHRDLKPANMFLAKRPRRAPTVKVLDFGLSKAPRAMRRIDQAMTVEDTTFGTPQYMSPEQVRSAHDVDARTDQHAIGLVLFEMIAGKPPFTAKTAVDLMARITIHDAPPLRSAAPTAPAGLEAAIARSLAKKPDDRFPSLVELAAALAPFGSAAAQASAANIRASLSPASLASAPRAPGRESGTDFTSSDDPPRRTAVRVGLIAAAVIVVSLTAALGVAVLRPAAPPVVAAAAVTATASAAPELKPIAAPEPTVTATAAATAAPEVADAPTASATATVTASRPTAKPPRANNVRGKNGLEVFGSSRK